MRRFLAVSTSLPRKSNRNGLRKISAGSPNLEPVMLRLFVWISFLASRDEASFSIKQAWSFDIGRSPHLEF